MIHKKAVRKICDDRGGMSEIMIDEAIPIGYILRKNGWKCSICRKTKIKQKFYLIHKDGDPENKTKDNLMIVCDECVDKSRKEGYPRSYKEWTKEDDEQLKKLYSKENKKLEEIARIIKRHPGSVQVRLRKLGLTKSRLPDLYKKLAKMTG